MLPDEDTRKSFKKLNNPSHRVLRYVLKVGDLEEATHVFVDLLEMQVFNHMEYEEGSADGDDVHYEGQWSRTLVGYGKTESDQVCIQLTLNHGVAKYARGNHFQGIEIQLGNTAPLEDAGFQQGITRGKSTFFIDCNGYNIEVVKSTDGKNRISGVILNCDEPIKLSGPTIGFWTQCLGFEIVSWSTDPNNDVDRLIEYTKLSRFSCCCCFITREMKKKSAFKLLEVGELPYVELQYGSTKDFRLRLQSLPPGVPMDVGTGMERLLLTCTKEYISEVTKKVNTIGKKQGGSESKKSFQLIPGRVDLVGVVVKDPSGLEVCFYDDIDVRNIHENQLDAETDLRHSITVQKRKIEEFRSRRRSMVTFHM